MPSRTRSAANVRVLVQDQPELHIRQSLYPLQVGFRKRGECGIGDQRLVAAPGHCIDDDRRHSLDVDDGQQPRRPASIPHRAAHARGAVSDDRLVGPLWARCSMSDDLPRFVVIGTPIADCCGGMGGHGASYLGPEHDGIQLSVDPKNPSPLRDAGARRLPRRAGRRVRASGPAEPPLRRQVSRRPRPASADQVVRAGLPHADGRPRGHAAYGRAFGECTACTGWTRMSLARSARCV